jgi:hypothetical protein
MTETQALTYVCYHQNIFFFLDATYIYRPQRRLGPKAITGTKNTSHIRIFASLTHCTVGFSAVDPHRWGHGRPGKEQVLCARWTERFSARLEWKMCEVLGRIGNKNLLSPYPLPPLRSSPKWNFNRERLCVSTSMYLYKLHSCVREGNEKRAFEFTFDFFPIFLRTTTIFFFFLHNNIYFPHQSTYRNHNGFIFKFFFIVIFRIFCRKYMALMAAIYVSTLYSYDFHVTT